MRRMTTIREMPGAELIEALGDSYHHVGLDDTIVVTRSNTISLAEFLGVNLLADARATTYPSWLSTLTAGR